MAGVADGEGPGRTFWLGLIGALVAFGVGLLLFLVVFDRAASRWSALGAFVALGAVLLLVAWIHDRRQVRQYEQE
jgi:multisubunit Na+/H+ antiporter MnhB subunit